MSMPEDTSTSAQSNLQRKPINCDSSTTATTDHPNRDDGLSKSHSTLTESESSGARESDHKPKGTNESGGSLAASSNVGQAAEAASSAPPSNTFIQKFLGSCLKRIGLRGFVSSSSDSDSDSGSDFVCCSHCKQKLKPEVKRKNLQKVSLDTVLCETCSHGQRTQICSLCKGSYITFNKVENSEKAHCPKCRELPVATLKT